MSEVVMHRVDDRLIHGQVIVGWVGLRNANAIWIVDDFVAKKFNDAQYLQIRSTSRNQN